MPGDSHRSLSVATSLSQEAADLIYVPIWVMALRYAADKPPIRVLINGQTGKAGGKAPLSPIRIAILVVLIIAAIVGIIFWVRSTS